MVGVASGNGSEEVWLNLDFSTKNDKLSIGSRFKPEVNISCKTPRGIYRQDIKPTGSCCWTVTCLQDSAWASQDACGRPIVASILPSEIPLKWFLPSPALSFFLHRLWNALHLVRNTSYAHFYYSETRKSSSELLIDLSELASSNLVDLIPAKKVMFSIGWAAVF